MFDVLEVAGKDMSWLPQDRYVLADTPEKATAFLQECLEAADAGNPVGFDIETTGLSMFVDRLVGFSLAPEPGRAAYFPIAHVTGDRNLDLPTVLPLLREVLTRCDLVKHNGSFDWSRIRQWLGIDSNWAHDSRMQCILLDSDRSVGAGKKKTGLDALAREVLGLDMLTMEDLGLGDSHNFALVSTSDALWYAAADSDVALRLHFQQMARIKELNMEVVYGIEMKAKKMPAEMTRRGFCLDEKHLSSLDFTAELARLENEIAAQAGVSINVRSHEQLADLLFNRLKLPRLKGDSVADDVLEKLEQHNPIITLIRKHGDLDKLKGAFLDKLDEAKAEDGRVHLEYEPLGTRTGRFSSAGGIGRGGQRVRYNGQTWPKAKDGGFNVRRILRAADHHVWISMDYSQIEYRILAVASGQQSLIDAFLRGVDFHQATASLMLGVPEDGVTPEQRGKGKTLNFGIVYGMSIGGLQKRLSTPQHPVTFQEARALHHRYFESLDRVKVLIEEKKKFTWDNGFIATVFGRRRWFRDLREVEEYVRDRLLGAAFNTFIQGSAADINKCGLARVWKVITRMPFLVPLSSVHDEANLECPIEVPPRDVLLPLAEAMSIRPGFVKGWPLGFPADVSVGPSYGRQYEVPPDWYGRFETWEELFRALEEREREEKEAAKRKKASSVAQAPTVAPERAPVFEEVPAPRVRRISPAVLVDFAPGSDARKALEALKQEVSRNHGAYRLYIAAGEGTEFLTGQRVRVNPTERFLSSLRAAGMTARVFSPAADPAADFQG